jgi:ferrochelatase
MFFRPEPAGGPASAGGAGVLLCNLGTPDAPTPAATRRYLAEFLSDRRVVEMPRWLWRPILHGFILRARPARSAAKYRAIWQPEGSPLMVHSQKQAALLRGYLGERGVSVNVRLAMRYGQPSIASQLDALKASGCARVLVAPLYPQYSAATTASVSDAVGAWARRARHVPALRFMDSFHDEPLYIAALARHVRRHWQSQGRAGKLLMSFHGLPERAGALGDPYARQCRQTARLLAGELGLKEGEWAISFQSRFGAARWEAPATLAALQELGRAGTPGVDVICPGFVSDCLETLEEIAIEGRAAFLAAGGREFRYVPCLNEQPDWLAALAAMVQRHLQGWQTHSGDKPYDPIA